MDDILRTLPVYEEARKGPGKLSEEVASIMETDEPIPEDFRGKMTRALALADETHKAFLVAFKQWYDAERAAGRSGLLKDMKDKVLALRIKAAL